MSAAPAPTMLLTISISLAAEAVPALARKSSPIRFAHSLTYWRYTSSMWATPAWL
ncbi:Uncharacterised protein [Mycobacteroides abscessus subsp. abscessus]|nr:Uncharacterised protein [Mycobacteroides abscessus subsp. abscessus]